MEYYESYIETYLMRDTNQKEIDIVLEQNGILHPLEIYKNAFY